MGAAMASPNGMPAPFPPPDAPAVDFAPIWVMRGFDPVPLAPGDKKPTHKDWPKIDFGKDLLRYFPAGANLGIKNGTPYGNTDIDLDCIEAIRIWPEFAPATNLRWGRASKPNSHWAYHSDPPAITIKFEDTIEDGGKTKKVTLLDLRGLKKSGDVGEQDHGAAIGASVWRAGALRAGSGRRAGQCRAGGADARLPPDRRSGLTDPPFSG